MIVFPRKRNAARTAFVFAVAAAVGKRLRAEAVRDSIEEEETEGASENDDDDTAINDLRYGCILI